MTRKRSGVRLPHGPPKSAGLAAQGSWPSSTTEMCFTPPPGRLQDGVTYSWHTYTGDGELWRAARAPWTLRIVLHLGEADPMPRGAVGTVSVDLGTGNLEFHHAGPTLAAVGGAAGVAFTYNSQVV